MIFRWLQTKLWGLLGAPDDPWLLVIARHAGSGDPPPMHWVPCHPSTIRRFKATMTCPAGHGLVLKNHSVGHDGSVAPSVVCETNGCSFHRFVRLGDWSFGHVER